MESTQEKLLIVASGLFADKGFAAVSMRDIAAASGITQAAIYHHFANKEDLYFAAVRHLMEEKLRPLSEITQSSQTAEQQLTIYIDGLMRLAIENPQFGRVYYRELIDGDQTRLLALAEDVLVVIEPALEALIKRIAPNTDSHLATVSLLGMVLHHAEVIKLSPLLPWGKPEHGLPAILATHISTLFINGLKGS